MRREHTGPAPGSLTPTHIEAGRIDIGRRAGLAGLAFVVLLLLSAGMASVPGGQDASSVVQEFYTGAGAAVVIVVAQVIGLLAAGCFAVFSRALSAHPEATWARSVRWAGYAVAGAAVVTAVPVLWLCGVAEGASPSTLHRLALLCDLTDVLLFTAVAVFAANLARASDARWFRLFGGAVAVITAARALLLLAGSSFLGLLAPLGFIGLVLALSVLALARPQALLLRS